MSELRDTVRPAAGEDGLEPETLRAMAQALIAEGSRRLARAEDLRRAATRKERLLAGLALEQEGETS